MLVPLIIVAAVLLLIALILSLRVCLTLICRDHVTLDLRVLFVRKRLYPSREKPKEKKRSEKKRSEDEEASEKEKHRKEHEDETPLTLTEKIRLTRGISAIMIRCSHKHLRLRAKRLHIRVATGDAAETAIVYGAVSQSLAYLLAGLDKVTDLRAAPPDVAVTADFLGERPSVDIKLIFSISVWGAFAFLAAYIKAKRARKALRRDQTEQDKNSDQNKKGT